MKALRRWLAILAASLSLVLGVASLFHPDRNLPRAPAWEGVIAPLAGAPIAKGAVVGFVARPDADATYNRFLLLEAAWLRPDVRWTAVPAFPLESSLTTVVVAGDRPLPPGWYQLWAAGQLRLVRRASP